MALISNEQSVQELLSLLHETTGLLAETTAYFGALHQVHCLEVSICRQQIQALITSETPHAVEIEFQLRHFTRVSVTHLANVQVASKRLKGIQCRLNRCIARCDRDSES